MYRLQFHKVAPIISVSAKSLKAVKILINFLSRSNLKQNVKWILLKCYNAHLVLPSIGEAPVIRITLPMGELDRVALGGPFICLCCFFNRYFVAVLELPV